MLLEALEILQSAESDQDTFVTDFGIYKIIFILTVYIPFGIATFLLSQEYLGEKIACFPPENFTEAQGEATQEYCWNEGFWISDDTVREKMLYTQPHRYYPLYLPIQGILFTVPVIFWNIMTKSRVLAALRGTEEFLEELLELITGDGEEKQTAARAKQIMKQYHNTCVTCARGSSLSTAVIVRMSGELALTVFIIITQFHIYNFNTKAYHCTIPHLTDEEIMCTVPVLDLLDVVWSINVGGLVMSLFVNLYMWATLYSYYFGDYQPMFFNNLPYGADDDFNENVEWENNWVKNSYRLLIEIFKENNSIMTKSYVLSALRTAPDKQNDTPNGVGEDDPQDAQNLEDTSFIEALPKLNSSTRKRGEHKRPESDDLHPGTDELDDDLSPAQEKTSDDVTSLPPSVRKRLAVSEESATFHGTIKPSMTDYSLLSIALIISFVLFLCLK